MKKNILSALALCALVGFSSCDSFLELEPLDKVSGDRLTETDGGMKALLANVYATVPMEDFVFRPYTGFNARNYDGVNGTSNIAFLSDEAARSEGGGGITENFDYWPYGDIRQVNIFIETVKSSLEKGILNQEDATRMIAEARFASAYIYFGLSKRYGGVPVIDRVQDGDYVPGNPDALKVPRSTEADTWKFIIKEFGDVAKELPAARDGYRFTKWGALGMKSRTALFAASLAKYWDKAPLAGDAVTQKLVGIDKSEADYFYGECISAAEEILSNYGGSLYGANPASVAEARENFQKLFIQSTPVDEVLLSRGYVDGSVNNNRSGHGWSLFYSLAQVNPGALRYGRFSPTLDLVDLFEDYTDDGTGKSAPIKTRADGNEANVPNVQLPGSVNAGDPYIQYGSLSEPFQNKDARLQASIIVPGSTYAGVPILMQGGLVQTNGSVVVYNNSSAVGKDGKTYFAFGAEGTSGYSGFGNIGNSENGNYTTTGFSVRKYMEEEKFSSLSSRDNSVTTPFIDIRLAEIYLDYAEAVVESGKGDRAKAAALLNALRHRAAHTDNIPLTLENVLKERRVELAFEGKRFWDMVRRRDNHIYYNGGMRSALVPMIDLRTDTPSYIFVRANFHGDEKQNGRTFAPQSYYRGIPGTATNGLVQNPGY
ncbi:RagB/SusD family nutrient uptake outer membrane protein [Bacteroides rodentium]